MVAFRCSSDDRELPGPSPRTATRYISQLDHVWARGGAPRAMPEERIHISLGGVPWRSSLAALPIWVGRDALCRRAQALNAAPRMGISAPAPNLLARPKIAICVEPLRQIALRGP